MRSKREVRNRVIRISLLLIIGWSIVAVIEIFLRDMIENSQSTNSLISFMPIYNMDGSLFHSITGIGYQRGLLLLESVTALLVVWLFMRMMDYGSRYFRMKKEWLLFCDFGFAAIIARICTRIANRYTLDYWGIGDYIYDFFDICIGICMVGLCLWLIRIERKYLAYKKIKTKGMTFHERFRWSWKIQLMFGKAGFIPKNKWQYDHGDCT